MSPHLLVLGIALLTSACQVERTTPNRGQAIAFACHWLEGKNWDWGPVTRVWPPTAAGASIWQRTWQVDFIGPTADGGPASLLVAADEGWVSRPPSDQPLRIALYAAPPEAAAPIAGTWILILDEGGPARREPANARRLALAEEGLRQGLPDRFQVRPLRDGGWQLTYGWDGERGVQRDEAIARSVQALVPDLPVRWVDLR